MEIYLFIILVLLDLIISEDSNEEEFNKFNKLFLVFYLWKINQSFKNQIKGIILYLYNMAYKLE